MEATRGPAFPPAPLCLRGRLRWACWVAASEAQMRLLAAVASIGAVVLALILLVRGRPLVDRRPIDPPWPM